MSCSFHVAHGNHAQKLRAALGAQRRTIGSDPLGYLDPRRWIEAETPGHTMILLRDSVGWLYRRLYFDPQEHAAEDLAFIGSRELPSVDQTSPRSDNLWLVAIGFLTASAALEWMNTGTVPTKPLIQASACFEARFATSGSADRSAAEFIASASRARAELVYAEEFLRRALCEDWSWIIRQFEPGFEYILKGRRVDADGLIILFCYQLARHARCNGEPNATKSAAQNTLLRCCDTWRAAVIQQAPWVRAPYVLYLCIYAFERTISGKGVTVSDVNDTLLGELAENA